MLIRGQLVLNINLKQPYEIHNAINLLLTIQQESLPVYNEEAIKKIKERLAAGTWVTSDKIVFPRLNRHFTNDNEVKAKEKLLKSALFNAGSSGTTVKKIEKERRSEAAKQQVLKRKRDKKTGHFLPGKITK